MSCYVGVMDFEPALSADGSKLYFLSNRPDGGEFFPSVTSDGTLYFTRNEKESRLNQIFRSRWVDSAFQKPELLPEQVNCCPGGVELFKPERAQ